MVALVTHRNGDLFSAATSLGILCYNVDRETAADLIVAAVEGLELEDAYKLLDNSAPAAEWRATLAAAMASDLESLDGQVEALAAAADSELVALKEQLAKVSEQRNLDNEIAALRLQIREREADVRAALIKQFGDQYSEFWVQWSTRFERERLAELEAANG
ncbi:MAG: hypothetical protein C0485_07625 [Pirellula sp.]|nr:hypothetical protein [Pirellula sp.]